MRICEVGGMERGQSHMTTNSFSSFWLHTRQFGFFIRSFVGTYRSAGQWGPQQWKQAWSLLLQRRKHLPKEDCPFLPALSPRRSKAFFTPGQTSSPLHSGCSALSRSWSHGPPAQAAIDVLLIYLRGENCSYEGTLKSSWKRLWEIIVWELKLTDSSWIAEDLSHGK